MDAISAGPTIEHPQHAASAEEIFMLSAREVQIKIFAFFRYLAISI
jgi:hypothetical protein